jgi:hypothetical protein
MLAGSIFELGGLVGVTHQVKHTVRITDTLRIADISSKRYARARMVGPAGDEFEDVPQMVIMFSHCWADISISRSIVDVLSNQPHLTVIWDVVGVRSGADLHPQVQHLVTCADAIVVHLTPAALTSVEVRDELARAHEAKKPILVLRPNDGKELDLNTLPWFLRDARRMEYSSPTSLALATDELVGALRAQALDRTEIARYFAAILRSARHSEFVSLLAWAAAANIGVLSWYLANKLFSLGFWSVGGIVVFEPHTGLRLTGFGPTLWGILSFWSVPLAAGKFVRAWRSGSARATRIWRSLAGSFVGFLVAATVFYNSGFDAWLEGLLLNQRTTEFLSTAVWGAALSVGTCLGVTWSRILRSSWLLRAIRAFALILATVLVAYLLYAGVAPDSDIYRGLAVGVGLRTGMFLALVFLASQISCPAPQRAR